MIELQAKVATHGVGRAFVEEQLRYRLWGQAAHRGVTDVSFGEAEWTDIGWVHDVGTRMFVVKMSATAREGSRG